MRPEAKQLTRAILTRSRELGVSVGKTKLLKLLYLADIEHVRDTSETLTGLRWIFYLYGPWSPDYDSLLEQLEDEGAIFRTPFSSSGTEGEQLAVQEELDLLSVVTATAEYFRTKHLIDTWLERATPELLDFVYFETEPMRDAIKQTSLDFSKVNKEPPSLYRRSRGTADAPQKARLRARLVEVAKRFKEVNAETRGRFDPGYGEDFAEALALLNAEEGE